MQYIKLQSANEIYERLIEFEACFPHLKEKISSLQEFSKKLYCNAEVYIAYEEECIGFVAFYANDKVEFCGYITLIGVIDKFRNKGLGRELMDYTLSIMKTKGMQTCKLEVDNDNYSAQTFYQKLGFLKVNEKKDSFYMIKEL